MLLQLLPSWAFGASVYTLAIGGLSNCIKKITEINFEQNLFDMYFDFSLVPVTLNNIEEVGFMTYAAASHQGTSLLGSIHVVPL